MNPTPLLLDNLPDTKSRIEKFFTVSLEYTGCICTVTVLNDGAQVVGSEPLEPPKDFIPLVVSITLPPCVVEI